MILDMTLQQFIDELNSAYIEMGHNGWRYGQLLFNALLGVRPDIAEEIRATPLDPFYKEKDEVSADLWDLLKERW